MAPPGDERDYDIIAFGVTGDAGRAIAQYLSKRWSNPPLKRWAIAGRNAAKLQALRSELVAAGGTEPCGVMLADCSDEASMVAMARRGRVVLSAAGPYAKFGEPVVAACIQAGTHYADITGEFPWVARMHRKYEARAAEAGICLCSFCGYDSVPAEVALASAFEALRKAGHAPQSVELCSKYEGGGVPHGTMQSAIGMLGFQNLPGIVSGMVCFLPPAERGAALRSALLWMLPRWSCAAGGLALPNVMGIINLAVLSRTAHSLGVSNLGYKDLMWSGAGPAALWGLLPALLYLLLCVPLVAVSFLFHSLPGATSLTQRLVDGGHYVGSKAAKSEIVAVATATDHTQAQARVRCIGDPGIHCTAHMACECVLSMLDKGEKLPVGFTTPGIALAGTLEAALRISGVKIDTALK